MLLSHRSEPEMTAPVGIILEQQKGNSQTVALFPKVVLYIRNISRRKFITENSEYTTLSVGKKGFYIQVAK